MSCESSAKLTDIDRPEILKGSAALDAQIHFARALQKVEGVLLRAHRHHAYE
jgi:hypothetical protein